MTRATAMAELERRIVASGLPRDHFQPRVLLQLQARLSRVLDLTDAAVRKGIGLGLAETTAPDWSRCHEVAREARAAGYSAIRFPSATRVDDNLAIFLDRLGPDEGLDIDGVEDVRIEG
jgi:RES domain-containing protein